jgi:signal peptidase I
MEPTIKKGADLVVDRFHYASADIERWDIVIIAVNYEHVEFLPRNITVNMPAGFGPHRTSDGPANFCFVKRIAGLPGEQIEFSSNRLIVNGHPEPYPSDIQTLYREHFETSIASKIPGDSVFLLSDNLRVGVDSRHYGPIPTECIIGRVVH